MKSLLKESGLRKSWTNTAKLKVFLSKNKELHEFLKRLINENKNLNE